MLTRILSIALAVALVVMFASPFVRDAYHRYQVASRLDKVMTEHDRIAFNDWNGDAASFAKTLYERCRLSEGQGTADCDRYRLVLSSQ